MSGEHSHDNGSPDQCVQKILQELKQDPVIEEQVDALYDRLFSFGIMVCKSLAWNEEVVRESLSNRLRNLTDPNFREKGSRY